MFSTAAKPVAVMPAYVMPSTTESNSRRKHANTSTTASPFSSSSTTGATSVAVPTIAASSEPVAASSPMPSTVLITNAPPHAITAPHRNEPASIQRGSVS